MDIRELLKLIQEQHRKLERGESNPLVDNVVRGYFRSLKPPRKKS